MRDLFAKTGNHYVLTHDSNEKVADFLSKLEQFSKELLTLLGTEGLRERSVTILDFHPTDKASALSLIQVNNALKDTGMEIGLLSLTMPPRGSTTEAWINEHSGIVEEFSRFDTPNTAASSIQP
jgi:hypothetical protein